MGIAASRVEERTLAAFGMLGVSVTRFEACEGIQGGGVLFLLPFLIESGLMSYRNHYNGRKGYYDFDSFIILYAFLVLLRIKSMEQTKRVNPGEFGKLVGYDRMPETKKFRGLIREMTEQKQCSSWGAYLSEEWINEDEPELYYIDGHVQVYHGYLANLGKKHVSRQHLCLPGMMEFWVNSVSGEPFFFITADVNEKMIAMLEEKIIPELIKLHKISEQQKIEMANNENCPLFTPVFDREAYSPAFFKRLWDTYRIAILTYRKNVKEQWDETVFKETVVKTPQCPQENITMLLHEEDVIIEECSMREVRKLSDNGHQTSILTTNRVWVLSMIAAHMFRRWIQENFFRYMRQEYAMDKIIQYAVEEIDSTVLVVNREYNNITYAIKKEREKISRRKAKLYELELANPLDIDASPDEKTSYLNTQLKHREKIEQMKSKVDTLIEQRKLIPYKITVAQMPEDIRYNKLNQESKHLQNIIKMICFRAETAFAKLLSPHYNRAEEEIRSLVKAIINQTIDLSPDYQNKKLYVTLYPLANPRSNYAIRKVIDDINQINTVYPGTSLTLCFKVVTINSDSALELRI